MPRKPRRRVLTGIEIGTSTIKVVMGEFLPDDVLAILGVGQAPSLGVQKGSVLDADTVLRQLARAVNSAEEACGESIRGPIFLAATGPHVRSVVTVGRTMIQGHPRTVSEDDIVSAVQAARSYTLPPDQKMMHTWERCFQVDDGDKVPIALGQVGDWLAAEVLLIIGEHGPLETLCCLVEELMGFRARDIAFSAVADCFAAFGPEDAEQGQLLLDIGAGVTEYVVFQGNGCYEAGLVAVGCDHIANDLAIALQLPHARCKALVRDLSELGFTNVALPGGEDSWVDIHTGPGSGRRVPRSSIDKVVELRLAELFEIIRDQLERRHALDRVGGGVRLCGGGALIPGVETVAQNTFGMPASRARARLVNGQESLLAAPQYLTPIGLLRWGRMVLEIENEAAPASVRQQLLREMRRLTGIVKESFRF